MTTDSTANKRSFFASKPASPNQIANRAGLAALYRKELADHLRSKRFFIILALIAITSIAGIYTGLSGLKASVAQSGSEFVFLKLFTSKAESFLSFIDFIALLGPLVGLALGFDAINGERSHGTLNRLVAQPIYRDSVFNGKFMAGVTVITIMVFSLGMVIGGAGLVLIGVPPTLEELIRILCFLLLTVVYMSLWLALSLLFSIIFRHAATSALTVIAIWLFFALFMMLLTSAIFPVTEDMAADLRANNYTAQMAVNRISPSNLYSEAVTTILDPNTRTLGLVYESQVVGAIDAPLPVGQSLLLVWPHLTGLLALTIICFAVSYVVFMRQEIRAG